MANNYEVADEAGWWGDDWKIGVTSAHGTFVAGTLTVVQEPEWKPGDRLMLWRHDTEKDELVVRIPHSDSQLPDEGLWIERRYFVDDEGTLRARPTTKLRSFGDDDPLGHSVLNSIGLRDVKRQLRRHLLVMPRRLGMGAKWDQATVKLQSEGRPRTEDALLAQWAERYVQALQTDRRRPYAVLMEKYPYEVDATLRMRVRQARDRGLLTKVGRGQTGGALTPKAEWLLKGEI